MPMAMVPWGLDTTWGDDVQQASELETHHTDILSETLASSCRFTYLSFQPTEKLCAVMALFAHFGMEFIVSTFEAPVACLSSGLFLL
jgi:hypothetical protein